MGLVILSATALSACCKYVMLFNVASHQVNKQVTAKFVIGKERGYNL